MPCCSPYERACRAAPVTWSGKPLGFAHDHIQLPGLSASVPINSARTSRPGSNPTTPRLRSAVNGRPPTTSWACSCCSAEPSAKLSNSGAKLTPDPNRRSGHAR